MINQRIANQMRINELQIRIFVKNSLFADGASLAVAKNYDY